MNDVSPILNVVDVGSRGGAFPQWGFVGSNVNYFGFEPDETECQKLNHRPTKMFRSEKYFPYAIANTESERTFYVTKAPSCSSLLKPNAEEWSRYGQPGTLRNERGLVVEERQIRTLSLDTFCTREELQPDFLKLDTQGSELSILEGYVQHLEQTLGFEIEVEFVPLYAGQPLFSEIELFLRSKGYELFGLKRNMWKFHDGTQCTTKPGGRLTFADALFLRADSLTGKLDPLAARKFLVICLRYNLYDLADHIAKLYKLEETNRQLKIEKRKFDPSQGRLKLLAARLGFSISRKTGDRGKVIDFDDEYGF